MVSSAQAASIQGLPGVLEQFPPEEVYLGVALPETAAGKALNEAILNGDFPAYSLESGQSLQLDSDVQVRVLLRTEKGCALRVEMGNFRALLPGGVALEELLGAQVVISAQPGSWVAPANGGWVHVSMDGERMWVEEGK